MSVTLPPNVHISKHPCLRAKLSQLRSDGANARETKALVHEIALIVGVEALADLEVRQGSTARTPIDYDYATENISPEGITLVPILRSGLGMVNGQLWSDPVLAQAMLNASQALETILPFPVSVHHLGLFREKASLQPVEYYNNLPQPKTGSENAAATLAILLDPVIATGGTSAAAIQTLRDWGVERIILIAVLGALPGVTKAAEEWPERTEVWVGGLDPSLTDTGMIKPGLGDIGDRLFLTIGK